MAEIVENPTWQYDRRNVSRYPWETWLDGQARILERGTDFHGTVHSVQNTIGTRAHRSGISVRTRIIDPDHIQIQADRT